MPAAVEFFVGKTDAWHRLGKIVGRAFGREDIMREAPELLMPVRFEPTFVRTFEHDDEYNVDVPIYTETPQKGAVVRADGKVVGEGLGKGSYGIVQPSDALEWGEQIADLATFPLVSAGTIYDGRQFFFTYDVGTVESPLGGLHNHLTVASSHDGTMPLMALHSSIVVVCANTLAMAKASSKGRTTLKHTVNVEDRLKAAIDAIKDTKAHVDETLELMQALDRVQIPSVDALLNDILGDPNDMEDGRAKTTLVNVRSSVRRAWGSELADGLSASSGLRFVQAVNTHENWAGTIRGVKGRDASVVRAERQFEAMVKGQMKLTDKAVERVLALA